MSWMMETSHRAHAPTSFILHLSVLLVLMIIDSVNCQARRCPKGQFSPHHADCTPCKSCGDTKTIRPCTSTQDTVCADVLLTKVKHFPCVFKKMEKLGLFVENKVSAFPDVKKKTRDKIERDACNVLKKYRKRILESRKLPYGECAAGTFLWSSIRPSSNSFVSRACRPCSPCPNGTHVMSPCGGHHDTMCSFPRVKDTMELFHFTCPSRGTTLQVYSSRPPLVSQSRLSTISHKLKKRLCRIIHEAHTKKHRSKKRQNDNVWIPPSKEQDAEKQRTPDLSSGGKEWNPSSVPNEADPILSEGKKATKHRPKETTMKHKGKKNYGKKTMFPSEANPEKEPSGNKRQCVGKRGRRAKEKCRKRIRDDKKLHQLSSKPGYLRTPSSWSVRGGQKSDSTPTSTSTATTTLTIISTTEAYQMTNKLLKPLMRQTTVTYTKATVDPDFPGLDLEEEDNEQEGAESKTGTTGLYLGLAALAVISAFLAVGCFVYKIRRIQSRKNSSQPKRDKVDYLEIIGDSKENQSNDALAEKESKVPEGCSESTWLFLEAGRDSPRNIVDPLSQRNRPRSQDSGFVSSNGSSRGSVLYCRESNSISRLVESPAKVEEVHRGNCRSTSFLPLSTCNSVLEGSDDPQLFRNALHCPGKYHSQGSSTEAATEAYVRAGATSQRKVFDVLPGSLSAQQVFNCNTAEDAVSSFSDFRLPLNDDMMPLDRNVSTFFPNCYRWSTASSQSHDSGFDLANPNPFAPFSLRDSQVQIPLTVSTDLQEASGRDSVGFLPYRCPSLSSDSEMESSQVGEEAALSLKPRKRSRDSSMSSVSSLVSIHIKISPSDLLKGNMPADWLQKDSTVGPENLLSTYSSSTMTQTDDWDKTNLRPKPLFCTAWQTFQSISPAGGTFTLPNSDVRLEVPPNAVPSGSYADITAATYTNLSHLRRVLTLGEDEIMVGPMAEFHAGSGFQFQEKVDVYLPHCLPAGVAEEHVKLHHIQKGRDGELIVKLLPPKKEYDRRQRDTRAAADPAREEPSLESKLGAEEDIGFFQFLPNGELVVSTKSFCGYICTICGADRPEPQVHLVATAKQFLQSRGSGERRQVSIYLYFWDRKILITDFQRDYPCSRMVGKQTLHVTQDHLGSVVKVVFNIYDTENDTDNNADTPNPSWKHAVRPRTTDPVFPAEKEFPLKELLCCEARDSPRCEEWLVESLVKPGDPFYDFQCFIDIYNIPSDQSEGSANRKQVTMFIGNINNNGGFESPEDVLGQPKTASRHMGGNSPTIPCHHDIVKQPTVMLSNTPFGKREQGSPFGNSPTTPCHHDTVKQLPASVPNTPSGAREQGPSSSISYDSYFPDWQHMSDPFHSNADPILSSVNPAASSESDRPVSCPAGGSIGYSCQEPAADLASRAGQGTQTTAVDEKELEQQAQRGRTGRDATMDGPRRQDQTGGLPHGVLHGQGSDDTKRQRDDAQLQLEVHEVAEGLPELQRLGEGASSKTLTAAADDYLSEQAGERLAEGQAQSVIRIQTAGVEPSTNCRRPRLLAVRPSMSMVLVPCCDLQDAMIPELWVQPAA